MSERSKQVREHRVHQALAETQSALGRAELKDAPDVTIEGIGRFKTVASYAKARIGRVNAELVALPILSQIESALVQLQSEVKTHLGDHSNAQSLANAHGHADSVLELAGRLGASDSHSHADASAAVVSTLQHTVDQLLDRVRARTSEVEQAVGAVREAAATTMTANQALAAQITQQGARIDSAVGDLQRTFNESEDRRRQEFDTLQKELKERTAEQLDTLSREIGTQREGWAGNATVLLKEIQDTKDEAKRYYRIITNVGVTGNYKREADAEHKQANLFRGVALALMLAIVAGVALTIDAMRFEDGRWAGVLLRIGVTLALAYPAAYAARESDRHRRLARHYRRMELELSSVDTYLGSLDETKRAELKASLAERYFGRDDQEPRSAVKAESELSVSSVDRLVHIIEDLVKRTGA